MVCIRFEYLNKADFNKYSSVIFDILADNMTVISPTGNTREEDFAAWYRAVGQGIKKDNRHIILIREAERVIGFFQYCIIADTFSMEEIQLSAEFQGKAGVFRDLYGFVLKNIGTELRHVEAYANKKNKKSIGILGRLGLKLIGENESGRCFHFKGDFEGLMKWYTKM